MVTILSLALPLFLLMNSFGNAPIFLAVLKEIPVKRQRFIILRELLIALAIMITFHFIGDGLLAILHVEPSTVLIAGGIILFLIALKMIFPISSEQKESDRPKEEPFIVPLAIPLVAGPGTLAAIILYSNQQSDLIVITAIVLAWVASTIVLYSAPFLKKMLGARGMLACERLMGLVVTLIAIEMFLKGIRAFLQQ